MTSYDKLFRRILYPLAIRYASGFFFELLKKLENVQQQDGDFGDDGGDCEASTAEPNDIDIEAAEEEGRRRRCKG